jgi:preprotein translocase subunit SecG
MLLTLLLVVEIIVSLALVGVVLLQRSEGGVLGQGGGPSGFMTARGAGDLMTRITWTLGAIFFILALTLTLLSGREKGASSVVNRLNVGPIDTSTLNTPPPSTGPAGTNPQSGPAPLQAPTPTVRNPFGVEEPAAPAAPATAPAPKP